MLIYLSFEHSKKNRTLSLLVYNISCLYISSLSLFALLGFKEVKKACCGSGPFRGSNTCGYISGMSHDFELCENVSDYMLFDSSHTTEKANRHTAESMLDGPSDLVGPFNLKTLFQNL